MQPKTTQSDRGVWHLVRSWDTEIIPFPITRETADSIFYLVGEKERRAAKESSYERYFKTRTEAIKYLREKTARSKHSAFEVIAKCDRVLSELDAMAEKEIA